MLVLCCVELSEHGFHHVALNPHMHLYVQLLYQGIIQRLGSTENTHPQDSFPSLEYWNMSDFSPPEKP